jgi:hypothetical protein
VHGNNRVPGSDGEERSYLRHVIETSVARDRYAERIDKRGYDRFSDNIADRVLVADRRVVLGPVSARIEVGSNWIKCEVNTAESERLAETQAVMESLIE